MQNPVFNRMTMPNYKKEKQIPLEKTLLLYNDVNWAAYTQHPKQLEQAIQNSLLVISAWEEEKLIGLIRLVGDGLTIIYIQDILVLEKYQRKGIGRTLMNKALEQYPNVRQKVLMTDDTPKTRAFYQSLGFQACDDGNLLGFMKID